jgi:nucleoside-diphosphate-sugar epimerase
MSAYRHLKSAPSAFSIQLESTHIHISLTQVFPNNITTMTQTVLVTGASGFIAAHIIEAFLSAGFHVRGTVRNESSAQKVREAHPTAGDALSFAIVPDIAAAGAFDEAVKTVDGVIHTASPFTLGSKDFQTELYDPAVNGTTSVLKAVKASNPNIKRIVITSSFASVLDVSKGSRAGYTYTEKDWNPMSGEEAIKLNDPVAGYLVSKTLAEKAAWDFVENEKPNFSISTLTPPMVYGPLASTFESLSKLNTSSADIYRLINGSEKSVPDTSFWAYIDVRDRKFYPLISSISMETD